LSTVYLVGSLEDELQLRLRLQLWLLFGPGQTHPRPGWGLSSSSFCLRHRSLEQGGVVIVISSTTLGGGSSLRIWSNNKSPRSTLCGVGQPKWHEQILKQAKWHDNCHFWDVRRRNRDLVITLDKIDFCNHASNWKGLVCLAMGTYPGLSPN
jgi:hypothetical protein